MKISSKFIRRKLSEESGAIHAEHSSFWNGGFSSRTDVSSDLISLFLSIKRKKFHLLGIQYEYVRFSDKYV